MANDEEESKMKIEMREEFMKAGSGAEEDLDELGDDDNALEDFTRKSEALYKSDQMYLQNLLPEEMWRVILNKLEDSPEDLQNCANASPYFWELHRDERMRYLFPGVFDILVGKYEARGWFKTSELEVEKPKVKDEVDGAESDEEDPPEWIQQIKEIVLNFRKQHAEDDEDDRNDNQVDEDDEENEDLDAENWKRLCLPADTKENDDKWISAVMNCRLVCTFWNKAIEMCYSRAKMNDIEDFNNDPNPLSPVNLLDHSRSWIGRGSWIHKSKSAEGFIKHFEATHYSGIHAPPKNPVIGRRLLVDVDDSDFGPNRNKKRRTGTQLLKMFGKELWYSRIVVNSWRLTHDLLYLTVRERLSLMPNLRYLELGRIKCKGNISPGLVTSHPMPKLENLEMIDIHNGCGGPIINEILRKNCHITNLTFRDSVVEFDEEIGRSLSNLTTYSARAWNREFYFDEMVKKFGASWKLSKASLYNNQCDLKGMFQLLENNWAETLTALKLEFDYDNKTNVLEQSKNLRLNLPHVRHLHLHVMGFMLLDFILPMAGSLEHLEVFTWDPKAERDGFRKARNDVAHEQVIEYAGFEKRMHLSNIWQIFRKLKTIKVELLSDCGRLGVYTRDGEKLVYLPKNCSCHLFDTIYR